jgi:hypothetical protein
VVSRKLFALDSGIVNSGAFSHYPASITPSRSIL